MSHDDVTCEKLILECLFDFEDGTMPEEERRELQRHFEMCPPCMNFLTTYRATGRTLKMLKPREIPPALAETVLVFVRKRCGKEEG
jgi:putative zinc finger protein